VAKFYAIAIHPGIKKWGQSETVIKYVKQKQPWGLKKRALPSKVGSIEQVNDI